MIFFFLQTSIIFAAAMVFAISAVAMSAVHTAELQQEQKQGGNATNSGDKNAWRVYLILVCSLKKFLHFFKIIFPNFQGFSCALVLTHFGQAIFMLARHTNS